MPILDISIMWRTGQSYSVTLTSVLSRPRRGVGDYIKAADGPESSGVGRTTFDPWGY